MARRRWNPTATAMPSASRKRSEACSWTSCVPSAGATKSSAPARAAFAPNAARVRVVLKRKFEFRISKLETSLVEVRQFLDTELDPVAIDRQANIPRNVIDGLGRVGVLGMTAPKEFGGRGFSQMANCRILEEIGSRCASTSVFVNAHHSIGIRALLLFGTHEQKQRWLPKLSTGEQLGAFALTEKE